MIDRDRLASLRAAEEDRFVRLHPRSGQLAGQARGSLLAGAYTGSWTATLGTQTLKARATDDD